MGNDKVDLVSGLQSLRVKLFADGADSATIRKLCENPLVKGFTTNPTMMHSAGVSNYETFARDVLDTIGDRPISFEVFSDDDREMERQARKITSWGSNVYVKIPITNTKGKSTKELTQRLAADGIKLNITAVTTTRQVEEAGIAIESATPAYISVFAGRIADTGVDPVPMMRESVQILKSLPNVELIWASPREVLNIFHAESAGCHVITLTNDLLKKLPTIGKDLEEFSLDTVKMFYEDGARANLVL